MCILFSRVIPIGHPQHEHELWKRAELFGASCRTDADPGVTHVVTKALGTQKVFATRRLSCL